MVPRRDLSTRLKAKKLFDPNAARKRWPEVKARLLRDGENADLAGLALRRPKRGRTARRPSSDTGERQRTIANPFTETEEASP
ncbi:hypothetical protein MBUL_04448 (plasmid) [Methylobacterium bullatum]|uniref:Uncharacterized protein n=1 Tax=Methylobacterium bullatum TaxID=570505 RepID=A0A679J8C4_9HYPH|nr:hypothetical protein MBUL_04448 [Methylobacterium bullatum]